MPVADEPPLPAELVDRYLAALGVPRREPGPEALAELVAAHVVRVPFENVSKLYRLRRLGLAGLPPLELFLEGVERHRLGGTCYSNNIHLWSLLVTLGYEARLCGADMSRPDVHVVIVVRLGGREHLVDAGYGAPFFSPLPLDGEEDRVIAWGHERYVLKPRDAEGRSRLELHRGGAPRHGYLAKPGARAPDDFRDVIAESFRPDATFMNAVTICRFEPRGAVVVRNLEVLEVTPRTFTSRALPDRDALVALAEERLGIPGEIVAEAVGALRGLRDAWR